MEQATPTGRGQPTVQQMFATLLGEITSLRRQNEEQQRQLENLQKDMSLVLQQSNTPTQASRKSQFEFERLPLEIREMMWELAVPVRLLAFEGVSQVMPAPSALSVPTIAHAAEHIIIDGGAFWDQYSKSYAHGGGAMPVTVEQVSQGVKDSTQLRHDLLGKANISLGLEGDPVYNLRTIDFAMADFFKVDQDYPPNLVRRLFVEDSFRILDLRDEEAVFGVQRMLEDELSKVMDTDRIDWQDSTLQKALTNFKAVANGFFPSLRASILYALADSYHQATITRVSKKRKRKEEQKEKKKKKKKSRATLPSPFRGGELHMEVAWVKELTKRIEIRPVFVFVRA